MQKLWCWRCRMEVAMLDEIEYQNAYELYGQGIRAPKGTREERFKSLLDYYFQVTGEKKQSQMQ